MSTLQAVIFDLDGTLIDSAPGILKGFELAFQSLKVPIARPLSPEIIGPPMRETLELLLGHHDPALLDKLASAFKEGYDSTGYQSSVVYPGIPELLISLNARGIALFLATNKRHTPTQKIIDFLGWRTLFKDVLSFDSLSPARNKAGVIAHLIDHYGLDKASTCYVGDRYEDGVASDSNDIPFIFATWGYGSVHTEQDPPHWRRLAHADINAFLATAP